MLYRHVGVVLGINIEKSRVESSVDLTALNAIFNA